MLGHDEIIEVDIVEHKSGRFYCCIEYVLVKTLAEPV